MEQSSTNENVINGNIETIEMCMNDGIMEENFKCANINK
jgi:hypothetical protein